MAQGMNASGGTSTGFVAPHRSGIILVLGILSLVACAPLGIAAWTMGNTDLKAMNEGRMDPSGQSVTHAGKILGIVGTCILILAFAAFALGMLIPLIVAAFR